jgi:hypothetical protein
MSKKVEKVKEKVPNAEKMCKNLRKCPKAEKV